jgi:hypothetical protein
MVTKESILRGIAGEYFVAAELSKRGYIAIITLRNTETADILCSDLNAKNPITIQVKTKQEAKRIWPLHKKAENLYSDKLYYIFVILNKEGVYPDFFIVSSRDVANYCKESHKQWLETLGKKGQKHNDNLVRNFCDIEGKYLGKWDLLKL